MLRNLRLPLRLTTLSVGLVLLYGQLNAQLPFPTNFDKTEDEYKQLSQEPGAIVFSPPQRWHLADPEALPPSVKLMVVGKGNYEFPPSINLSTEEFEGTVKDYLKIVKEINSSQGSDWKDLGVIRTKAGEASLSQADVVTEWGGVRMMHVIISRNGMIYILTAAALKEEFPKFYKTFFESLRSLRINKDPEEMVNGRKQTSNNHAT
ncbi:MAG: hypothetical protein K940chlam7_00831 [Chlamydiae bacterium]|nr:hypothetical protein [Chlamydiota bacterium]